MASIDDALYEFERGEKHLADYYSSISEFLNNEKVDFELKKQPLPELEIASRAEESFGHLSTRS